MLLLAEDVSIQLESLNLNGKPISETPAILQHLDSEQAIIRLHPQTPKSHLRWGLPVRFRVEQEAKHYDISGVIVGWNRETDGIEPEGGEIQVRIWDYVHADQRRDSPRRKGKFAVSFRPASRDEKQDDWQVGWCLDIGGGGIRIRVPRVESFAERLELEFTPSFGAVVSESASFRLTGRTLRSEPYGRHSDQLEVALKFESLSVEDGMALASFLK